MKVKLLTSIAGKKDGRQFSYQEGEIVDIDDATAKRMIAKHRAIAIDTPSKGKKTSPSKEKKDTE